MRSCKKGGQEVEARIFEDTWWINEIKTDLELREEFEGYLQSCEFHIFGFMEYHFHPYGYAAIWLIGESHLAIHTFHEHGKIYIQLSSCNEYKSYRFKEIMAVRYPHAQKIN